MNKIKFFHNWNDKLNHKIFTTIRKFNEEKYVYYCNNLGNDFEVELLCNGDKINGKIVTLISVELMNFYEVPQGLLRVDTGFEKIEEIYELFRTFGIGQDHKVLILTFGSQE